MEAILIKCRVCGKEKPISQMRKNKNCTHGVQKLCNKCNAHYNRMWTKQNPIKSAHKSKKWRENNIEAVRLDQRERRLYHTSNLSNSYVKYQLIIGGYDKVQITPELIECKRLIMKTKRLIKEKQAINN